MNTNFERTAFEAAYQADAIAAGLDIGQQLSRAPHDQDRYADAYAQAAWFGWQARAAQPAPVVPDKRELMGLIVDGLATASGSGFLTGTSNWAACIADAVLSAAAPAQGQQVERWIPVSERLPEPFTVVALLDENRWMNTGCDDFEANWTGAGWLWANGINDNGMYWSAIGERHGLTMDSVTHWMSLPAAPTKGGDV